MTLVESLVIPRQHNELCGDQVVVTDFLVAVLDAASAKPWDPPGAPTSTDMARQAGHWLETAQRDVSFEDVVEGLSGVIANMKADVGLASDEGGCLVLAIVHLEHGWIGRCGDVSVLVDGRHLWVGSSLAERTAAQARALVLNAERAAGASLASLRRNDPGRAAVLGLIHAATLMRNRRGRFGYAVIDGGSVCPEMLDTHQLEAANHEVVLASDGYIEPRRTLATSEAALRERLDADPLLIAEPPTTKAWHPDAASFDDRAYARVLVELRSTARLAAEG